MLLALLIFTCRRDKQNKTIMPKLKKGIKEHALPFHLLNRIVHWIQQWVLLKKNNCVMLWPKPKIWSLGQPLGLCSLKNHQIYHLSSLNFSSSFPIMSMSNIQKKNQEKSTNIEKKCFYKVQSLCYSTELKLNSCILQYRYLSMPCTWCKIWKSKVHSYEQQRACTNISMDSKFPIGHYFSLNLTL